MKNLFCSYPVETVGSISPNYLRGFVRAITDKDVEPVNPAGDVFRPFVIHLPRKRESQLTKTGCV